MVENVLEMSDIVEYAKSELDRIMEDEDEDAEVIKNNILEIIKKFADQGHNGFSASYVINVLERLMRWKPISPLTGEDDEWVTVFESTKQNKRCSSVFLKADGIAYDINGITVSDNGGITWFSSGRFRKEITFPYMPPIEPEKVYIEYTEDVPPGFIGKKYDIITDDKERIKRLYERKRKEFDDA